MTLQAASEQTDKTVPEDQRWVGQLIKLSSRLCGSAHLVWQGPLIAGVADERDAGELVLEQGRARLPVVERDGRLDGCGEAGGARAGEGMPSGGHLSVDRLASSLAATTDSSAPSRPHQPRSPYFSSPSLHLFQQEQNHGPSNAPSLRYPYVVKLVAVSCLDLTRSFPSFAHSSSSGQVTVRATPIWRFSHHLQKRY